MIRRTLFHCSQVGVLLYTYRFFKKQTKKQMHQEEHEKREEEEGEEGEEGEEEEEHWDQET